MDSSVVVNINLRVIQQNAELILLTSTPLSDSYVHCWIVGRTISLDGSLMTVDRNGSVPDLCLPNQMSRSKPEGLSNTSTFIWTPINMNKRYVSVNKE